MQQQADSAMIKTILPFSLCLCTAAFTALGQAPAADPGDYEDSMCTDGGTRVEQFAEPGTEWRYSGGGFVLLQLLVEERTGEEFDECMERTVLHPLGMARSRFGWREELARDAAVPYRADGRPYPTYRFSGTGGAGLYTSVADLARFAAAGLDGAEARGRGVLGPETVATMFEPTRLNDGEPTRCGLGYFLASPDAEVREAIHGGSNNGWQAVMVILPDQGRGIAILTNSNNAQPILPELVCSWARIEIEVVLSGCR